MIKKSNSTESPSLREAPKTELAAPTLERIAKMKAKVPREGITIETHRLPIDRIKLETYRRLKAEIEKKLSKKIEVEGLDAVIAAAEDLRKPLAASIRDGRVQKKVD
jgi:hypothetical protein